LDLGSGATFTTVGNFSNAGVLFIGSGITIAGTFHVNGNYTQSSTGTLSVQIGGAPSTGNFGQFVATGSVSLAGGFVAGTGAYAATAGQTYQVMSFTSATGSFS